MAPQEGTLENPKVFISYSHDSDKHKAWVLGLAERLVKDGVKVTLDQWDLELGGDVAKFMEDSVSKADHVLMICTETYVQKMDTRTGGVGYEVVIVTGELIGDLGTSKFIPVIRQKGEKSKLPKIMATRLSVNLNDGKNYEKQYEKLVRMLHNTPAAVRPELGENPFAGNGTQEQKNNEKRIPIGDSVCQLPKRPAHFVGREKEIERVIADLEAGNIATLCGTGGIGKSAVAAEVLWRMTEGEFVPDQFPDGVIYHNFYREPEVNKALENIAISLGDEATPTPLHGAMRALSGRRVLLLLDGTEDADHLPAILEIVGNCGVIVTSRKKEDAEDVWQDIEPLGPEDAIDLLQGWGGEFVDDDAISREICELIGRLPLAIRLVGWYLTQRRQRAASFLESLRISPLKALDPGKRKLESVPLLLNGSLDQVSREAKQAMSVIGLLALYPFSERVIAASLNLSEVEASGILGELTSWGMLIPVDDNSDTGCYEVSHALIHTYAREKLAPTQEINEQVLKFYNAFFEKYSNQTREGYETLDPERLHIMKLMESQFEKKNWQAVTDLVWAVEDYLDLCGYWIEQQSALEMGIAAARKMEDARTEGAFIDQLGSVYLSIGQVEKAIEYYEQAIVISREIKDRRGEGSDLANLGDEYIKKGQVEKGRPLLEQAIVIFEEIKSPNAEIVKGWLEKLEAME